MHPLKQKLLAHPVLTSGTSLATDAREVSLPHPGVAHTTPGLVGISKLDRLTRLDRLVVAGETGQTGSTGCGKKGEGGHQNEAPSLENPSKGSPGAKLRET